MKTPKSDSCQACFVVLCGMCLSCVLFCLQQSFGAAEQIKAQLLESLAHDARSQLL